MVSILKLTTEQDELLKKFEQEYLEYAVSTEPINKKESERTIEDLYLFFGKFPTRYWYVDSPVQLLIVSDFIQRGFDHGIDNDLIDRLNELFDENFTEKLIQNIKTNIPSGLNFKYKFIRRTNHKLNLRNALNAKLEDQYWANVDEPLDFNLEKIVRSKLLEPIINCTNIYNNLYPKFNNMIHTHKSYTQNEIINNLVNMQFLDTDVVLTDNLYNNLSICMWGDIKHRQLFYYLFITRYFRNYSKSDLHKIFGIKYSKRALSSMSLIDKMYKICFCWLPLENICFVSERPIQINIKERKLHNDSGPSIQFKDGYSLWHLNGVAVNKDIVTAPAEKLDCRLIFSEKNVEVRREIVRKIGLKRILKELNAKSLDKWNDYELLELNLPDGKRCPYLKMVNPSIGTIHIEGVAPKIRTVKHALSWRNGLNAGYKKPEILT